MLQKLIHPTDMGKADREREAPDDNFFFLFLTSHAGVSQEQKQLP